MRMRVVPQWGFFLVMPSSPSCAGTPDRDPPWQQKPVVGRIASLWREDGELGECFEVAGVECVNSADVVRLHGGDDLQIEHVAAGHRVA